VRPVFRPASDKWHDQRRTEIGDAGGGGADHGDVSVILELREVGVIVLKDTEREWKAPEQGFEDEGGEEKAPCWEAAVGWREG